MMIAFYLAKIEHRFIQWKGIEGNTLVISTCMKQFNKNNGTGHQEQQLSMFE
jgi:hypothetical protein